MQRREDFLVWNLDGTPNRRDYIYIAKRLREARERIAELEAENERLREIKGGPYCYCGMQTDACDGWKTDGICDMVRARAQGIREAKAKEAGL